MVFLLIPFQVIAEDHIDENANQTQIQAQQELSFKEEQDLLSKRLTAKAESLVGTKQGQCVVAVRNFLGVGRNEISGAAKTTKVNSKEWSVGAIIVFHGMSKDGHVAIALFATADNWLYYWDSNADGYMDKRGIWHGTEKAKIRKVKLTDKRISGYRKVPLTIFEI